MILANDGTVNEQVKNQIKVPWAGKFTH